MCTVILPVAVVSALWLILIGSILGIHGTAGFSNVEHLDLESAFGCVLNMQKYALSMGCASRYPMAVSQRRIPSNCRGRSETECM